MKAKSIALSPPGIPRLRLPLYGWRSIILQWGFQQSYPIYARLWKRNRPAWQVNRAALLTFTPGTLGHALGRFLQANELELLATFEGHDTCHTLLAFGTSAPEEVMLQWALFGNGKRTPYCLFAILLGSSLFPEHWRNFQNAYRLGAGLRPFHHWYFEYLLQEDLEELRAFLLGHPHRLNKHC